MTTTTYLPAAAPSNTDEYTRCFVQAPQPRLNGGAGGVEWTGGAVAGAGGASPSVQTAHSLMRPPTSSSSPRLHPLALVSTVPRSDVQYRFYDEC